MLTLSLLPLKMRFFLGYLFLPRVVIGQHSFKVQARFLHNSTALTPFTASPLSVPYKEINGSGCHIG